MDTASGKAGLPNDYPRFLSELKERIRAARIKAALSVNCELIALYWDMGRRVVEKQNHARWGTKVIERLAYDLRVEFPGMSGLSASNIWRMRAFYSAWADTDAILAQPVRELPWGHNITLVEKAKTPQERLWYARQVLEHGWSREVLVRQIESGLHLRQGKAQTNFARTLPAPQSELAQEALKDGYALDFLGTAKSRERDIERGLIENVQSFLLELGKGFAFVGRQHRLKVGGEDFYIDLLFYNLILRCYVVIELKKTAFRPEHAGKLSFYLSAVDGLLRHPDDRPSIGMILCKSIGVSSYRLTKDLPDGLAAGLPTAGELEYKLSGFGS